MTKILKKAMQSLAMPLCALLATLLVSSIILILSGFNALEAWGAILKSALGSVRGFSQTLLQATPLILCGLGMAVSFKGRIFNIGGEGQFFTGALFATLLAIQPFMASLPPFLAITLVFIASCIGGALMAASAGILRIKANAPEVVTTVMLNSIMVLLVSYLVNGGPLQEPKGYFPNSPEIMDSVKLPYFVSGTRLHVGFLLALAMVFVLWFLLQKTDWGFRIKTMGSNAMAAQCAGINISRTLLTAFAVSGALCGLAGGIQISGVTYMLYKNISPGYGFTAIAVAQLGRLNPFGIVISAILFGALQTGANAIMRDMGIPASLGSIIMAIMLFFVIAFTVYEQLILRRMELKRYTLSNSAGETLSSKEA